VSQHSEDGVYRIRAASVTSDLGGSGGGSKLASYAKDKKIAMTDKLRQAKDKVTVSTEYAKTDTDDTNLYREDGWLSNVVIIIVVVITITNTIIMSSITY
jgi:hypothetical protein